MNCNNSRFKILQVLCDIIQLQLLKICIYFLRNLQINVYSSYLQNSNISQNSLKTNIFQLWISFVKHFEYIHQNSRIIFSSQSLKISYKFPNYFLLISAPQVILLGVWAVEEVKNIAVDTVAVVSLVSRIRKVTSQAIISQSVVAVVATYPEDLNDTRSSHQE